ncbi:di-heme oxidoreductase family protein [Thiothrix lacustris]|uniref:di-heme oxidoreductase family protein n=1 Tax=Thiothrix lacustris TaxID=525917 RepID=UPI0027E583F9|nr:di-heme oxidoredictase family protein [Thiothrix lacustris]WMP18382.1 di-heme oxidoredictase family protein [Thiothrix lacustris]
MFIDFLVHGGTDGNWQHPQQQEAFAVGGALFQQPWVVAPASTSTRDGLGPLFNANSCIACHVQQGRGHPPLTTTEPFLSTLVKLSIPATTAEQKAIAKTLGVAPEPRYGDHLQQLGITGLPGEGTPRFTYQAIKGTFKDGESYTLQQPTLTIENLNYGTFSPDVQLSARVAPPLFGMGLLASIPDAEILAHADLDDKDGDGISGKANQVWDIQQHKTVLGRFSWKANKPSILQQSADAFRNDIGITSSLFPEQPCSTVQIDCHNRPDGGKPEIPDDLLEKVVFHVTNQPAPKQRNAEDPQVLQGQELFQQTGCTACHTPTFPSLASQPQPYSDLLLHDMGEALADHRPDFEASGSEWRTPPLWGIGLTEKISGHTRFLHDGRARNLLEAILWHGGESSQAQQSVLAMSKAEREALLRFLNSL